MGVEKNLFIVRHGKSSWDYPDVSDIDRPLKDRGVKDAYEMAHRVRKKEIRPDAIISSPANRALHTAIIFSRVLDIPQEKISINQDLYLAGTSEIISVIKSASDSIDSLMIFGHNPGFTDLANYLSGMKIDNVPTTGLVWLRFNAESWKKISRKNVAAEYFDFPRKE